MRSSRRHVPRGNRSHEEDTMRFHVFQDSKDSIRRATTSLQDEKDLSIRPRIVILSLFLAVSVSSLVALSPGQASPPELRPTMVVGSNHDNLSGTDLFFSSEIYLMDEGGTHLRRVTTNSAGDAFASLSPDGKWIV